MSVLKDLAKKIIQGVIPLTPAELAGERMKLCAQCPEFTKLTKQCKLCGCYMELKTRLLEAHCPKDLW